MKLLSGFLAGVIITLFMVMVAPTASRVYLHKALQADLQKHHPISQADLAQGQHLATTYVYGTTGDVTRWYYEMKQKYSR